MPEKNITGISPWAVALRYRYVAPPELKFLPGGEGGIDSGFSPSPR
ncbi:MAG: hypothetical protein WCE98_04850 [Chlorobium sp.]